MSNCCEIVNIETVENCSGIGSKIPFYWTNQTIRDLSFVFLVRFTQVTLNITYMLPVSCICVFWIPLLKYHTASVRNRYFLASRNAWWLLMIPSLSFTNCWRFLHLEKLRFHNTVIIQNTTLYVNTRKTLDTSEYCLLFGIQNFGARL